MFKVIISILFAVTLTLALQAQDFGIFESDTELSDALQSIVTALDLDGNFEVGEDGIEQISLAVIDLNAKNPNIGGVNLKNFIYPASVYKVYVAAEILNQVSAGKISLYSDYIVTSPNDVDRTKEITSDPRPLIRDGDTVNVNYLLDLMITRSDNSAANCLIDVADRKNINRMIQQYNWHGSEVTRKFLSRKFEDKGYTEIQGTETCALHAAEFLYKIETNQLINPWISMQMKTLLGRQLDKSKLAAGLPENVMIWHKTGWFSYWTNDIAIVDDGTIKYIVACFMPLKAPLANQKHAELSQKIYKLIKERYEK
ncbi:MAG: serine hydrolase [Candidatus Marinimicrobia bacterium]|nr:serine hydrolase [Candidatus Neomarinimicrobiota bacterium]